jgi:hypothetical protein
MTAAAPICSRSPIDNPKPSQRYLKFWDEKEYRKNTVSRKGAKAAKFEKERIFFECLASWRD